MALRYVVKARARLEIERAAAWWADNRPAAQDAVRRDLEEVLSLLVRHPGLGQKVDTGCPVQVRRYLMARTRHWLYFRVKDDVLEVLAVWSTSRERGPRV